MMVDLEKENSWAVLCDFDGTISKLDVGNEIHRSVFPEKFVELQKAYRAGELNLRQLQLKMWQDFPLSQTEFQKRAQQFGSLRTGFKNFLRHCQEHQVLFIVASCGIRNYIEAVLKKELEPTELGRIKEIHCNDARFSNEALVEFLTPEKGDSDLTLDKGKLARELRKQYPKMKILGIGNGTSDRSMAGHVDLFAATDALAKWAQKSSIEHIPFDDFETLTRAQLFARSGS
jgi:2-hydroxy-3-keto-5-methylthiopentenyl-1-phosphate phosphatase